MGELARERRKPEEARATRFLKGVLASIQVILKEIFKVQWSLTFQAIGNDASSKHEWHSVFLLSLPVLERMCKAETVFFPSCVLHLVPAFRRWLVCQVELSIRNKLPNHVFFSVFRGEEDLSLQSSPGNSFVF